MERPRATISSQSRLYGFVLQVEGAFLPAELWQWVHDHIKADQIEIPASGGT
jgi:hypothetical protein